MAQLNVHLTPEVEHALQRFKDLRGLPSKSEAVRVAVQEALARATRQAPRVDFRDWLGLGRRVPLNPNPRFCSHDGLWGEGR
jgi:hypothetical protein